MCLTATLTSSDQLALLTYLHINPIVIKASPYRSNLFYSLTKMNDIGSTVDSVLNHIFKDTLHGLIHNPATAPTTIVFCRSYQSIIRVYTWLEKQLRSRDALYRTGSPRTAEFRVLAQYHGVTDDRIKPDILRRLGKSIKLLVCTSAFGILLCRYT
jgi:superfamily II DNA helicase RecQ